MHPKMHPGSQVVLPTVKTTVYPPEKGQKKPGPTDSPKPLPSPPMHPSRHRKSEQLRNGQNNGLLTPKSAKIAPPQTPPDGVHAPSSCTSQTLEAIARDFVAKVHRDCAEELAHDRKALRAAVLRLVRRELPLRRGRPNDPRIDAAVRMVEEGKSIKEILRLQTRNFDKVDTYGRYLAEKGLRTAVTRRRKLTRNAHQK